MAPLPTKAHLNVTKHLGPLQVAGAAWPTHGAVEQRQARGDAGFHCEIGAGRGALFW